MGVRKIISIVGSGSLARVLPDAPRRPDAAPQAERGPYARIAILRPHDGHTVDFEAGYIRHLEWHRQARDTWVWYGWNVTFGERQRWFVYASFGHSAASLDSPVPPAEDERDNIANVTPHAAVSGERGLRVPAGRSRAARASRNRPLGSSSRPWTSTPGRKKPSRRPSARANQHCRVRRSGIGWWRVEPLHAMSDCGRGPACRRFSMEGVNRRSRTRSTT